MADYRLKYTGAEIEERLDKVDELEDAKVVIGNEEPTEGTLWIKPEGSKEIILAEIDDAEVSNEKTWSSNKIENQISNEIEEHKNNEGHITSAERASWNAKSNFSGNYNDLNNKPTIPSKTSQLTNDSGYITKAPVEVAVQSGTPSEGTLWVDTDEDEEVILAEIDDNAIDTEKTWSSNKINEEVTELNEKLVEKTKSYVTPEEFGAKANGWTDDTEAIQACLDYAIPKHLSVRGYGLYCIETPIEIKGSNADIFIKRLTYKGTEHAVVVKTAYSSIKIGTIAATNGSGVHFINGDVSCLYNRFENYMLTTKGNCISLGNLEKDSEINYTVGYNSFYTSRLNSSEGNCISVIGLNGGENYFDGNTGQIVCPNNYAFYFEKAGTINIDRYSLEYGVKSGFYVKNAKVIAGYIRNREFLDTKRIDSGEIGLMLKLVGQAQFYSDFTHVDLTCIDSSELRHKFEESNRVTDEESISYVKAGRYCNADYYGINQHTYDIPGYIKMTGSYTFLDYEGRQIYQDVVQDLDLRDWSVLPPNVIDIHADATLTLNDAYCANGINSITINQTYGYTVIIKDKNENIIFDGVHERSGTYLLQCCVAGVQEVANPWLYNPNYDSWKVIRTSEKQEVFEVIETFEVTEAISEFERTTEPDGTPYNFKNIFVHLNLKANTNIDANSPSNITVNIRNGSNQYYLHNTISKAIQNKDIRSWGTFLNLSGRDLPISSVGQYYVPTNIVTDFSIPKEHKPMNGISLNVVNTGVTIPVGSVITIMGVRE